MDIEIISTSRARAETWDRGRSPGRGQRRNRQMKKNLLKTLAGCCGLLVLLFALAIFWGMLLGRTEESDNEAHTGAILPYLTAVSEARYQEAYERYTSENFRKKYRFADFEAAHRKHPPLELSRLTGPDGASGSEPISNGTRLLYLRYLKGGGENDYEAIYYDVIKTENGPKIEQSYRRVEKKMREEIW